MIESRGVIFVEDRRLNKYIADSGYCSRREADRLIEEGKVTINGRTATIGERVAPGARVKVEKHILSGSGDKAYLAVHKPQGIVCTADPREPMNIVDYVNFPGRIYPIGRLDKDSEGLILLTSDGDIVNRILRASGSHEKEYEVAVDKPITPEFIDRMSKGVPILGQVTLPCRIRKTGPGTFRIILVQGLNRQIRRMCEYLGYNVVHLRRIRIMNITLGAMRPGHWRMLTDAELNALMRSLDAAHNGMPEE
ncbi:MAG: pseudouridine synthase [Clostridiales bacterium]|jgi:23S rRNA pseudouridine2604 synthase|nr:pseudouridine synthase [Clostridiales bacterium]